MAHELIVTPGVFLAAAPDLLDPNFMHSVVLLCSHSEEGAYGLVLNRASNFRAREVLGSHDTLSRSTLRVYVGGPVSLDTLQILHRAPDVIQGGLPLVPGLWIGGELDDIGRLCVDDPTRAERDVRLYLGYSGWGAGQLEGELSSGSWLPAPGKLERIFQFDTERLWRDVITDLGPEFRPLAFEPPEPEWN
ncbi:MAG: YqgE/AlgH family protein [Planctomycetaceae bacterium]|jgi:putative transcriptional regulator|nr:YqgE/AlgH family protein [Planctomycetaceae bacterium]